MRSQLVAARTVAEALVDLAAGTGVTAVPGTTGTPEIAVPRAENLAEGASRLVARRGDPIRIEGAINPADPDAALYEAGALLPGPAACRAFR